MVSDVRPLVADTMFTRLSISLDFLNPRFFSVEVLEGTESPGTGRQGEPVPSHTQE